MRLWHQSLIQLLPRQQLLGQHRECCAMRGRGWGKKHSAVDYVWRHPRAWLWAYHMLVMEEMECRGYKPNLLWKDKTYRGRNQRRTINTLSSNPNAILRTARKGATIFLEHNDKYLQECLENLARKGIHISLEG